MTDKEQYLNQVICGDSVKELQKIPDNFIDLTVTSPPYDDLREYDGYSSFDFETIVEQLFRITKKGGVVIWVVGDKIINGSESCTSFNQVLTFRRNGFNLHDTMIYQKTSSSLPDNSRYSQNFEYMFVLSKGTPKTVNLIIDKPNKQAGSTNPTKKRNSNGIIEKTTKYYTTPPFGKRGNIWSYETGYNKGTNDLVAFEHPATFPDKLAQDHIRSWSNEEDIVLDPFAGSGTTLKMAKINRRNYFGIEINSKYVEIIKKRLDKYNNHSLEIFS